MRVKDARSEKPLKALGRVEDLVNGYIGMVVAQDPKVVKLDKRQDQMARFMPMDRLLQVAAVDKLQEHILGVDGQLHVGYSPTEQAYMLKHNLPILSERYYIASDSSFSTWHVQRMCDMDIGAAQPMCVLNISIGVMYINKKVKHQDDRAIMLTWVMYSNYDFKQHKMAAKLLKFGLLKLSEIAPNMWVCGGAMRGFKAFTAEMAYILGGRDNLSLSLKPAINEENMLYTVYRDKANMDVRNFHFRYDRLREMAVEICNDTNICPCDILLLS